MNATELASELKRLFAACEYANAYRLMNENWGAIVAALEDADRVAKEVASVAVGVAIDGDARIAALESQLAEARAERDALRAEHDALSMAHTEARELLAEFDATGSLPRENIEALRALVWRADIKQGKVKHS